MNKPLDKQMTAAQAVAHIKSGMTVGIGGWGPRRKPMALILDGRVVTVATIGSPLPGNGIIEFGEHGPSRSELWEIVERLEAKE